MTVYKAKYGIEHGSCAGFGVFDDKTETSKKFLANTDAAAIGHAATYASILQTRYMPRRDGTTQVRVLGLARPDGSQLNLELLIKGN